MSDHGPELEHLARHKAQARETGAQLFEDDARLKAGERRAQAVMYA